jgi:hypothetical protein
MAERLREAYIAVRYNLKARYRNFKVKVTIVQTTAKTETIAQYSFYRFRLQ